MNGKGDTPRPRSVSRAELDERWARTFSKQDATPPRDGLADTQQEHDQCTATTDPKRH